MIEFWEDESEESGKLMHKLLAQVELIDFYLNKIEFYFSKKQHEDSIFSEMKLNEGRKSKGSMDMDSDEEKKGEGGHHMTTISEEDDIESPAK